MPSIESALASRIARVQNEIAEAATAADRHPDEVTLIAVSKTVARGTVDLAYAAGLRHFGENRVQDARAKFAEPLPADARLHLIGQLQSNKAKPASTLFDLIESVDRPSLITALESAARAADRVLPVLLQVNIAQEPQKAGCAAAAAAALAGQIGAAPHLLLRGLMTIAPLVSDPEAARPVFAALRELQADLRRDDPSLDLPVLSMGMSDDFRVAIAEGATHVRIGRAIFAS